MARRAFVRQGKIQPGRHCRTQRAQAPLLLLGRPVAAFGLMARLGQARRTQALVAHSVRRQRVFGQAFALPVQLDPFAILQHFDRVAPGPGDPVVIAHKGDESVLIGRPFMNLVGRRQVRGQPGQKRPFMLEGLGRDQPPLALRPPFHAHRRPLERLRVEIL